MPTTDIADTDSGTAPLRGVRACVFDAHGQDREVATLEALPAIVGAWALGAAAVRGDTRIL